MENPGYVHDEPTDSKQEEKNAQEVCIRSRESTNTNIAPCICSTNANANPSGGVIDYNPLVCRCQKLYIFPEDDSDRTGRCRDPEDINFDLKSSHYSGSDSYSEAATMGQANSKSTTSDTAEVEVEVEMLNERDLCGRHLLTDPVDDGIIGQIDLNFNGRDEEGTKVKFSDGPVVLGEATDDGTVRMKRQIGLLGAISLIVGTMIGSGIFVSPSGLLLKTESVAVSLAVWFACGILATLSALSYCELGTVVPRSGGEHAYYMAAFAPLHGFFGELPAFLFSWLTVLLLKPSSLSIASLAFGQYSLSPFLKWFGYCPPFTDTWEYDLAKKMLAVPIAFTLLGTALLDLEYCDVFYMSYATGLIATVNIMSAKVATKVQILFTGAKLLTMGIIISIGLYNMCQGQFGAIQGDWDQSTKDYGAIAVSFYSGLWAYDGWNNLNFVTEELKNPNRNLPLAILIGIPITTVLYLLVNLSYLTVLDKEALGNSEAVAVDVGILVLGRSFDWMIPLLVCLATIGSANGSMFTAGRISYVAGRDGHMIDVLSYVHAKRLTPSIAIMLNVLLAIPMIFYSSINKLIDLFGFASWIIYGLALVCVLVLRKTQPDAKRVFKVPLIIPVIAIVISVFLVLAPLIREPQLEYFYVLLFTLLGVCVYYPFVYKKYQLPCMRRLTKIIQGMTLVAPSPYKND